MAGLMASGAAVFFGHVAKAITLNDWLTLAVLAALLTLSLLLKSRFKGQHQTDQGAVSYSPMLVFVFAGAVLLPLALVPLLILVPHLVEWAVARMQAGPHLKAWYIQPFNIATHTLCTLGAILVYMLGAKAIALDEKNVSTPSLVVTLIAVGTYVIVNHLLVVGALIFARGVPWRESGLLDWHSLLGHLVFDRWSENLPRRSRHLKLTREVSDGKKHRTEKDRPVPDRVQSESGSTEPPAGPRGPAGG